MKRPAYLAAWIALASLLFAKPASAQAPIEGEGSLQVGPATVSVGGGIAILDLPSVPSFILLQPNTVNDRTILETFKLSDEFGDEIGGNVNGSIAVPIGTAKTVSLNGFWANIDDEDSSTCTAAAGLVSCRLFPIVDTDPNNFNSIGTGSPQTMTSVTERDVDIWGVSLESKWTLNDGVMGITQAPRQHYFALGADIRGIDQELDATVTTTLAPGAAIYTENLETRYYGAYAAWGGFLFRNLWARWGLQSSFLLRGGIYRAETDYEGRLTSTIIANNPDSTLSLSRDDSAFIGGLILETRKRIGQRATLSLKSETEYYSWVPEMAYNTFDRGGALNVGGGQFETVINHDDAFSARTSLRLTFGLGPPDLYQESLK